LAAIQSIGLPNRNEVVIPAYGWQSVFAAVTWVGKVPVIADVSPGSSHGALDDFVAKITERTCAVVVNHLMGYANDQLEALSAYCRTRGIVLIEDCAQAWGVGVSGRPVGTFGDFAFFSLQASKLLSCGEGGILIAREPSDAARCRVTLGYAIEQEGLGLNMRMSSVSAILASDELSRLDERLNNLRATHAQTLALLDGLDGGWETQPVGDSSMVVSGYGLPVFGPDSAVNSRVVHRLEAGAIHASQPCLPDDPHQARHWSQILDGLPGLRSITSHIALRIPLVDSEAGRQTFLSIVHDSFTAR
jgi:dTDP-4-amino-4,6-dideoxygalactose transaminase